MKENKRKNVETERGITLIALVITIIVLLILAGISISMLTGDSSILSQAGNAAAETDVAQVKEEIQLELLAIQAERDGTYTKENVYSVASALDNVSSVDKDAGTATTAKGNIVDLTEILNGAKICWYYDEDTDGNTIVTNGTVTLAIGDYVDYDPTDYEGYSATEEYYVSKEDVNGYGDQTFYLSSYSYGWRVLGADEDTGELLLVSEDYIGPDNGGKTYYSRSYYYLKGQKGYQNATNELDAISAIYGHGRGATGARSITVEDINKITGYNPETAAYGDGEIYEYGNEVTYTLNEDGFIEYTDTLNGLRDTSTYTVFTYYDSSSKKWISLENTQSVTLKSTYYDYYPNTLTTSSSGATEGIDTSSTEYKMLFLNSANSAISDSYIEKTTGCWYWLGSTGIECELGGVLCCVHLVFDGVKTGGDLFESIPHTFYGYSGIRPIVSLASDVSLSGSSLSGWVIN